MKFPVEKKKAFDFLWAAGFHNFILFRTMFGKNLERMLRPCGRAIRIALSNRSQLLLFALMGQVLDRTSEDKDG